MSVTERLEDDRKFYNVFITSLTGFHINVVRIVAYVSCYFEVFERSHTINNTNGLTLISRPFMSYFTIMS